MKRNLLLTISILMLLLACKSQRKKEKTNPVTANFFSYYNTLFNSEEALATELKYREDNHRDNFYAPYISIQKYENEDLVEDNGSEEAIAFFNGGGMLNDSRRGASTLEVSEIKALKAISNYSVMKDGEEKNKKMFDAHILLAQARLYMEKPLAALDALNYIFVNMSKDKRIALAQIYEAQAYAKMKNYTRANELFAAIKEKSLKKKYEKLYSIYYSESLLAVGKKKEAVEELAIAFNVNKNRETRSRIAYLRGQILAELGENEEARESFLAAYKYANNFEFEVKSQVEIAKTFNGKNDDYEVAKQYLEKISKKGTYASRKNEFYYALGLVASNSERYDEAQVFFKKAAKEKQSDPQLRGLTYYEIGKYYADRNDYISAGVYYDSALAIMNYEPVKKRLAETSKHIKEVSKNYYLIKKNDSILALTRMTETQRVTYFQKYIDELKAKEAKEETERKKAERSKGFDDGDYNPNSIFASSGGSRMQDFSQTNNVKGSFYFANQNTIARGETEFKQIWKGRSLMDDWRFSSKTTSIEDVKNRALGLTSVKDPMRFEPSFYIEKIPTDATEISDLKKARDTASLGIGRMYEKYFLDIELATKTLYDLVDNQPEEEVKLQALYHIFSMNYEKNPASAQRAKKMILEEFPYTPYAEFVKNPKSQGFSVSTKEVEDFYKRAFALYSEEKFEESQSLVSETLEKFPNDVLTPKFHLLNAFNTGNTAGKEVMILQLQQIALNYAKTDEGIKAQEMLNYLKSDLQVENRDEKGNMVRNSVPLKVENTSIMEQKSTEDKTNKQKNIQKKDLTKDSNLKRPENRIISEDANIED